MRFWDASAIVPLLVREASTEAVRQWYAADRHMIVWSLTPTEAWSAVARKRREGVIRSPDVRAARQRLEDLAHDWIEITDLRAVKEVARRLLDTHTLRAADALQLGAALVATDGRTALMPFLTLDDRLLEIAEREGLRALEME